MANYLSESNLKKFVEEFAQQLTENFGSTDSGRESLWSNEAIDTSLSSALDEMTFNCSPSEGDSFVINTDGGSSSNVKLGDRMSDYWEFDSSAITSDGTSNLNSSSQTIDQAQQPNLLKNTSTDCDSETTTNYKNIRLYKEHYSLRRYYISSQFSSKLRKTASQPVVNRRGKSVPLGYLKEKKSVEYNGEQRDGKRKSNNFEEIPAKRKLRCLNKEKKSNVNKLKKSHSLPNVSNLMENQTTNNVFYKAVTEKNLVNDQLSTAQMHNYGNNCDMQVDTNKETHLQLSILDNSVSEKDNNNCVTEMMYSTNFGQNLEGRE